MKTDEIDWRHNYERLHLAVTRSGTATELAMLTAENIQLRAAWAEAHRAGMLSAAEIVHTRAKQSQDELAIHELLETKDAIHQSADARKGE